MELSRKLQWKGRLLEVSLFETWERDLMAYIPSLILLELGSHVSKLPDSVYN